jgi:vacuolar-type H+-ATPase subunit C/Vma6
MPCKDKELVSTYEEHYKVLRPMGYKTGYRDYINTILNNGCAVDMETANKKHFSLRFYKQYFKYIMKLHPKLSKREVFCSHEGYLIHCSVQSIFTKTIFFLNLCFIL